MSFTINVTTDEKKLYPSLGVTGDSTLVEVEVEFEITGIVKLFGSSCAAEYIVTIGNKVGSAQIFEFEYSGEGNPIVEAEEKLKIKFS